MHHLLTPAVGEKGDDAVCSVRMAVISSIDMWRRFDRVAVAGACVAWEDAQLRLIRAAPTALCFCTIHSSNNSAVTTPETNNTFKPSFQRPFCDTFDSDLKTKATLCFCSECSSEFRNVPITHAEINHSQYCSHDEILCLQTQSYWSSFHKRQNPHNIANITDTSH